MKVKLEGNLTEIGIRHSMDQILFNKGGLMSIKARGKYQILCRNEQSCNLAQCINLISN